MKWISGFFAFLILTSAGFAKGESKDKWCWSDIGFGLAVGAGAVAVAPFALGAAGFTAGGVAAGSIAAGVQSAAYGATVASTSMFAGLQSAGAAGIGVKAGVALFTAASGAATFLKNKVAPGCNTESPGSDGKCEKSD